MSTQFNDVITLKGGQAQTTTHAGNLKFYQLCEERFDAFTKSASTDQKLFPSFKKSYPSFQTNGVTPTSGILCTVDVTRFT